MTTTALSPTTRDLLRAVQAGHVARRYHLGTRAWDARRADQRSGRGGGHGRKVTAAVERLVRAGLVVCDPTADTDAFVEPYKLTPDGRLLLDPPAAAAEAAEAESIYPQTDDGRVPFRAGEYDAPSGAVLDLSANPDTPGWWQRQGDRWVPIPDQTVGGLATLQFGPRSVDDYLVHLVRSRKREHGGGTPGSTLCGIDRSTQCGPGWSVGGGVSGPDIPHTPCPGCIQAARQHFPGVPVWGMGSQQAAAALSVASHWHSAGPRP